MLTTEEINQIQLEKVLKSIEFTRLDDVFKAGRSSNFLLRTLTIKKHRISTLLANAPKYCLDLGTKLKSSGT